MQSNRRAFLKGAIIAGISAFTPFKSIFAQTNNLKVSRGSQVRILPKALKKGDTIGLTAPGGFIVKEDLEEAVKSLERLGFKTYYRDNVLFRYGYFAGTDKERAEDLMHMFTCNSVDAIMCVRGGYGSNRVLDLLDFETIRQHPKALIGYSDITSLINAFYQKLSLVGFHGPVAISDFNDFTIHSFEKVLMSAKKHYKYSNKREKDKDEDVTFNQYTIVDGQAQGVLVGGNLVMLETLIGTDYEPDFTDKIVFLEEVDEKPYRIDRIITHLMMATNLNKAAGVVLGVFKACVIDEEEKDESFNLRQVLTERFISIGIPCFYGMPFGHVRNKITLPVGIKARMDARKRTLTLIEPAVLA